jgi:hypothetical protein
MTINLNELRAQVEILQWVKQRKAELAEIETEAKARIQEAMSNHDTGTLDGQAVVTWKEHKRTGFDQRAFKAALPEVAAHYTTTTAVRRFEVL